VNLSESVVGARAKRTVGHIFGVAAISAGLILINALLLVAAPTDWLSTANQIAPAILLLTCLWGAYRTMKSSPLALWTPMPWFLAACAAYFGFGPLVYHFGSAESVDYNDYFFPISEFALLETNLLNAVGIGVVAVGNDYFFPISEFALLETNLLNAVGIGVVAVGFLLGRISFARGRSLQIRRFNPLEVRRLMFIFLMIGISVKYLLAIPYYLGLISWTLPGGIQYLSTLTKIAIILSFVLIHNGFKRYWWLLYGLIGVEIITALMTLSKLAIIEVMVAVGLGWYLGRPNLRSLIVAGVSIAVLYVFVLSPFISFARLAAGAVGVGTVTEVGDSIVGFAGTRKEDLADSVTGVQGWWTRLSYSNAQAFAIQDYDHGTGGDTIGLAIYAFLPRLLFPDKPIMTPGREFTALITGELTETATAAGFFAEAYWNGGWILTVLVCLYVGMLFASFTTFAERTIATGKFEYLPIVMIGISMGYSPSEWLVGTYVGPLANAAVLYVVLRYLVMPMIRTPQKANVRIGAVG